MISEDAVVVTIFVLILSSNKEITVKETSEGTRYNKK